VHPLSFSSGSYDARAPQVRQVSADLWLIGLQNLHEKADTHLIRAHQIQQAQTSPIGECAKEQVLINRFLFPRHNGPDLNTKDLLAHTA
jgi:hypothetical protein